MAHARTGLVDLVLARFAAAVPSVAGRVFDSRADAIKGRALPACAVEVERDSPELVGKEAEPGLDLVVRTLSLRALAVAETRAEADSVAAELEVAIAGGFGLGARLGPTVHAMRPEGERDVWAASVSFEVVYATRAGSPGVLEA